MAEDDGLSRTPVLVEYLGTVFGGDRGHREPPSLTKILHRYSIIRVVARWPRYVRLAFDIQPISRLALRSRGRQSMAERRRGSHYRPREHSQASPGSPEGRRLGFQLSFTTTGSRSDRSFFLGEDSDSESLDTCPQTLRSRAYRQRYIRQYSRSRNLPLRRYVLERHLSVHRLLDRWKYRRDDQGGRGECCRRNGQDDRHPRPWPAGEQQGRAD